MKELSNRVALKADLEELHKEAEKLQKLHDLVQSIEGDTKLNKEDITKLKVKLDLLESKISYFSKSITELGAKVDKNALQAKQQQTASPPKAPPAPSNVTSGRNEIIRQVSSIKALDFNGGVNINEEDWLNLINDVSTINKNVADLMAEMESMRELKKKYMLLEKTIVLKLDIKTFEDWKQHNDLDQALMNLDRRFSTKNDLTVAIKKLKTRIVILEEATINGDKDNNNPDGAENNAMLAKKPLGGWSCASCQKDLVNIEGSKASYHPWAKLPKNNVVERLAKVNLILHINRLDTDSLECYPC